MIHILRILTGAIILYLWAATTIFFVFFIENNTACLPKYVRIPGKLCTILIAITLIIAAMYIVGWFFI